MTSFAAVVRWLNSEEPQQDALLESCLLRLEANIRFWRTGQARAAVAAPAVAAPAAESACPPEYAGDWHEAAAREVHAAWRDGMLMQGRPVAPERMTWETLLSDDRDLDRYIASRLDLAALRAAALRGDGGGDV